jgi:hypothetical protein
MPFSWIVGLLYVAKQKKNKKKTKRTAWRSESVFCLEGEWLDIRFLV